MESVILQYEAGHWHRTPSAIYGAFPSLSGYARSIYGVLCRHVSNDGQMCYLSFATIAHETGFSVRTIQRHVSQLEEAALIRVVHQGNSRATNVYTLLDHPRFHSPTMASVTIVKPDLAEATMVTEPIAKSTMVTEAIAMVREPITMVTEANELDSLLDSSPDSEEEIQKRELLSQIGFDLNDWQAREILAGASIAWLRLWCGYSGRASRSDNPTDLVWRAFVNRRESAPAHTRVTDAQRTLEEKRNE